jgi:ABC-type transport system substrate-binding protein
VDQWKQALGDMVKPKFTAVESLAYGAAARGRDYNDVFLAWTTGPAYEPDGFLFAQLNSKSSFNLYGVKDPEIDRATEAQRVEMDQNKRQALWQQVMDRDLDQVYRAFTYHGYKTMARRANVFNVLDAMHAWTPGFRAPAQWGWKLS